MDTASCGLFIYVDLLSDQQVALLPKSLRIASDNYDSILVRILTGNIGMDKANSSRPRTILDKNYMSLPTTHHSSNLKEKFETAFYLDIDDQEAVVAFDEYFKRNQRNQGVFEKLLNEISQFLYFEELSPTTAFLHLYRSLEWISYCTPMIYASVTRDFKKTYNSLKSFFTDDNSGEIGFFIAFLNTIIQGDSAIQRFQFEYCSIGNEKDLIETEFIRLAKDKGINLNFEDGVCRIYFGNAVKLFKVVRDRYFHFSSGCEKENIEAISFDIEDFIRPLNTVLINWISVVLSLIITRGYTSI